MLKCRANLVKCGAHLLIFTPHLVKRRAHLVIFGLHLVKRRVHLVISRVNLVKCGAHLVKCRIHLVKWVAHLVICGVKKSPLFPSRKPTDFNLFTINLKKEVLTCCIWKNFYAFQVAIFRFCVIDFHFCFFKTGQRYLSYWIMIFLFYNPNSTIQKSRQHLALCPHTYLQFHTFYFVFSTH